MPWHIIKSEDRFCVAKEGEDTPIEGGCHDTEQDAKDHIAALYANVEDASMTAPSRLRLNLISEVALMENGAARPIHILRTGTFTGMTGQAVTFEPAHLQSIVANFKAGKRRKPPITERHDWGRALGRMLDLWTDPASENLYSMPKWTADGRKLLSEEIYDGFSVELDPDDSSGYILIGGSLTNYPAVDGLEPVTLSAPAVLGTPAMQACMTACDACEQACIEAARALIAPGNESITQTLLSCAEACSRCEECCGRGDMSMCAMCADACTRCAAACEPYGADLSACADACRACAAACMAAMPSTMPYTAPIATNSLTIPAIFSAPPAPPSQARADISPVPTQRTMEVITMSDPNTEPAQPPAAPPPSLPPITDAALQSRLDAYFAQNQAYMQQRERQIEQRLQADFERRMLELDQRSSIETFARTHTVTAPDRPLALSMPPNEFAALLLETPAGVRGKWMALISSITRGDGTVSFDEIGSSGEAAEAADRWDILVNAKVAAGMSRVDAIKAVGKEHPDLYDAQTRIVRKGGR